MFLEGESYYLRRSVRQGAGRLRRIAEEARQHALSGHGDVAVVRHRPLLGELRRGGSALDDDAEFHDKTRPWFDTWGNAIAAYESIHMHDPRGPLADIAVMAVANMYFRAG